ncbi:MAG: TRAP transporter small permease [Gammaproteobacteria bacterium]|nr:TRAP transporter small permease [Gammaproteobacteria bacterium]MYF67106.1 TRAP transporter small permease [Gammaproteobacteria bacterium]MYK36539.1 TRAP transporter small permease [Gammaproteobacteria bacterium]
MPGALWRNTAMSPDGRVGRLARALALAGGLLLVGVMGMTVVSVLGRYLFNAPVPGDYEITELAIGIAVFAFFPYCHIANANIVVELFTGRMPPRFKSALDAVHNVTFAIVAGLITWRLFVGATHKLDDGETTVFLGIPVHWAYFSSLPGAGLLTMVCVLLLFRHLKSSAR